MKIRIIIPYLCPSGDLFSHCKYTFFSPTSTLLPEFKKKLIETCAFKIRYPKLISKPMSANSAFEKMGASLVVTSELLWDE